MDSAIKAAVVVRPFGPHATGDILTDPALLDALLGSENAQCIVRLAHDAPVTES